MTTLLQDIRLAIRSCLRKPRFSATVVLALAIGLGAIIAIFAVVDIVLLRPLPFAEPDQLVHVNERMPPYPDPIPVAPANFFDWQRESKLVSGMSGYFSGDQAMFTISGAGGEPERLQGAAVLPNFFSVLKVEPQLGRAFADAEIGPDNDGVALLSHGLWQRRFGGDRNILGQVITVDGKPREVIGVLPPGIGFPTRDVRLWLPYPRDHSERRRAHLYEVIARLGDGVTMARAQAEMETIYARLAQEYPDTNAQVTPLLVGLQEFQVGDIRPTLLTVLVAVALVLLLTCANVANLLLSRAASRRQEIALRGALGARRGRLMGLFMSESTVLALAGGALGVVLARGALALIKISGPQEIPRLDQVAIDGRVLLFAFFASLLTALLFGLAPVIYGSRADLTEPLKESGRQGHETTGARRTRNLLITVEVALALVVVVGAGLMLKTIDQLGQVEPGFEQGNLLTFGLALPDALYESDQASIFYQQLLPRLRQVPGVEEAGAGTVVPLSGTGWTSDFTIEGQAGWTSDNRPYVRHVEVSPGYFEALGVPLLAGRHLRETDNADPEAPFVTVINDTFRRQHFAGLDPVGMLVKFAPPEYEDAPWYEIVGVVGDSRQASLLDEIEPAVAVPFMQDPQRAMHMVLRTGTADPTSMLSTVRAEVRRLDPGLPLFEVRTGDGLIAGTMVRPRYTLLLLAVAAVVALLLAAIGIFGVMSYAVSQRTQEMGIRMALGGGAGDVAWSIMRRGLTWVLLGLGVGWVLAFGMTRFLEGQLYGVDTRDPVIFLAVAMVLVAVALLASYLPARRATKIDPIRALHHE